MLRIADANLLPKPSRKPLGGAGAIALNQEIKISYLLLVPVESGPGQILARCSQATRRALQEDIWFFFYHAKWSSPFFGDACRLPGLLAGPCQAWTQDDVAIVATRRNVTLLIVVDVMVRTIGITAAC